MTKEPNAETLVVTSTREGGTLEPGAKIYLEPHQLLALKEQGIVKEYKPNGETKELKVKVQTK